jgi:hypothetical protein
MTYLDRNLDIAATDWKQTKLTNTAWPRRGTEKNLSRNELIVNGFHSDHFPKQNLYENTSLLHILYGLK